MVTQSKSLVYNKSKWFCVHSRGIFGTFILLFASTTVVPFELSHPVLFIVAHGIGCCAITIKYRPSVCCFNWRFHDLHETFAWWGDVQGVKVYDRLVPHDEGGMPRCAAVVFDW